MTGYRLPGKSSAVGASGGECAFCGEALGKTRFCPRCGVLRSDDEGTLVRAGRWPRIGALGIDVGLMVVTLLGGWLVWFAMTSRAGQSPGKRIIGLRVINTDGTVAKPGKMVLRLVVTVVVVGWLDYVVAFFNRDSRTLHDYICRTLVVRAEGSEKLLQPPVVQPVLKSTNPLVVELERMAAAEEPVAPAAPAAEEAPYVQFDYDGAALNRLDYLHSQKLITDAEYEARRAAILDRP